MITYQYFSSLIEIYSNQFYLSMGYVLVPVSSGSWKAPNNNNNNNNNNVQYFYSAKSHICMIECAFSGESTLPKWQFYNNNNNNNNNNNPNNNPNNKNSYYY